MSACGDCVPIQALFVCNQFITASDSYERCEPGETVRQSRAGTDCMDERRGEAERPDILLNAYSLPGLRREEDQHRDQLKPTRYHTEGKYNFTQIREAGVVAHGAYNLQTRPHI